MLTPLRNVGLTKSAGFFLLNSPLIQNFFSLDQMMEISDYGVLTLQNGKESNLHANGKNSSMMRF